MGNQKESAELAGLCRQDARARILAKGFQNNG